jgi:hypothetical protein
MAEPGSGGGLKLPGVGKVSKKWVMIVGGASVVSIGYFLYRRKQSAAAAAAAPATDTTGTIDPLTGDVAGSEQDQADLAAMQAGGDGSLGFDGTGLQNFGGFLAASPAGATIPGAGGFTTNAEWAQQAEADLSGIGVDPVALSAALGHYLTGSPLSTAEQGLVDQARAEEGDPPVAGAGGYPPAMHSTPTGSGSGNGTPPPGGTPPPAGPKVAVPHVVGMRVNAAIATLQKAGFTYKLSSTRSDVSEYEVNSQTPGGGTLEPKGSNVDLGIKKL